jgi:hypothetical protein
LAHSERLAAAPSTGGRSCERPELNAALPRVFNRRLTHAFDRGERCRWTAARPHLAGALGDPERSAAHHPLRNRWRRSNRHEQSRRPPASSSPQADWLLRGRCQGGQPISGLPISHS